MIRPRYAVKLAIAKLFVKRGVLFTTVAVSGLLFSVLIIGIVAFTGAGKSTVALVKAANNGQYLVKVGPVLPGGSVVGYDAINLTADNIKTIRVYESNYYSALKEKYKQLGIVYTEPDASNSLLTPNAFASSGVPADLRYRLNFSSSLMPQFEQEQFVAYSKTANNTVDKLKMVAGGYGATSYYNVESSGLPPIPNQLTIINGKETFDSMTLKAGDMSSYGYSTNAVHNSMYEIHDQQLVSRYITLSDTSSLKGIPVIITAQEAVALFGKDYGISDEPSDVNAKVKWLGRIKEKLTGLTYQTCYRNQTEQAMLAKLQQDYVDIESHKDDKDYVKPTLIYDYPSSPCGTIIIKSDTRTKSEKDAEAATIDTQKRLGSYVPAEHRLITYQVVGFVEAEHYSDANESISAYLKNLLSYHTDMMDAIIPKQMYEAVIKRLNIDLPQSLDLSSAYIQAQESLATTVVAFPSINQARNFIETEACRWADTSCKRLFYADPYGSNYLLLDEVGTMFSKLMGYTLPSVVVLAGLIVWFMMSRVMTDNRKETAVYRAMGARRADIAAIYLVYTLIVGLFIAASALLFGVLAAYIIEITYGQQLGDIASIAFGLSGTGKNFFTLFDLTSVWIAYVCAGIIMICLVAVLQPLARNVLRPPIRDMRND